MITPPVLMAPSGRIFLRHPSHMGSIMIFNDRGTWRRVLVLDAKYRTCKRFGLFGVETPEFQNTQLEEPNTYWINYLVDCSTEAPDSWINENIMWDPLTSRERCDIWMKYRNVKDCTISQTVGSSAVQHCRNIQINGTLCDLPNIQTLARIYVDRNTIDQMDPTVEEYPKWSLMRWEFDFGNPPFVWSSTEFSSFGTWYISRSGHYDHNHKGNYGGIIPILEL